MFRAKPVATERIISRWNRRFLPRFPSDARYRRAADGLGDKSHDVRVQVELLAESFLMSGLEVATICCDGGDRVTHGIPKLHMCFPGLIFPPAGNRNGLRALKNHLQ